MTKLRLQRENVADEIFVLLEGYRAWHGLKAGGEKIRWVTAREEAGHTFGYNQ
jgi:hypothetical protein